MKATGLTLKQFQRIAHRNARQRWQAANTAPINPQRLVAAALDLMATRTLR